MAKKKALILYASITGNTEKVAEAFGVVCREYGFEADLVKITPKRDWDEHPVFVREYDLVLLGSPIIAGLPYKEVYEVLGLQGKTSLVGRDRERGGPPNVGPGIPGVVNPPAGFSAPGAKGETCKTVYGIVFTTYGGSGVGPAECYGTLEVEVELMRVNGIRTVGKFACPGKELRHASVDQLAEELGINLDDAQAMMQRFQEDPNGEEFQKLSKPQLRTLKELAGVKDEDSFGTGFRMMLDNDPLGCGKPGCTMWHYDFEHRPTSRDILKAKIFLSEIIEDYFLTPSGDPRPPYSTYVSIS